MTRRHPVPGSGNAPAPVVVGVDDPNNCDAALSYAAAEADRTGSTLTLVHVVDQVVDAQPSDFGPAEGFVREATEGRVTVTTSVRPGPVPSALVQLSRTASLLVVEHRRLSRLRRHSVPSVAGRVAGHVPCRMVSVPEDWVGRPGGRRRIVAGVDAVDDDTDELLKCAFARAAGNEARLSLLHAWSMSSGYDDALVDAKLEEEWSTTYRNRLRARLDALHLTAADVDVELVVVHQAASKALVEHSSGADLLMVGRGRSVHPLLHGLGSVPRKVLEDSRCPVEVVSSPG